jgi:hypothetical protein
MFLSDDRADKCWRTLLLRFGITIADSRICAHGDSLTYTLPEDTCDDRLVSGTTLFTLDDRGEYECIISIISESTIGISDLLIPLSEECIEYHIGICSLEDAIGVWIEKSLHAYRSSEKAIFLLKCRKMISGCYEKCSCRKYFFIRKIGVYVVHIPTREYGDSEITILRSGQHLTHDSREPHIFGDFIGTGF